MFGLVTMLALGAWGCTLQSSSAVATPEPGAENKIIPPGLFAAAVRANSAAVTKSSAPAPTPEAAEFSRLAATMLDQGGNPQPEQLDRMYVLLGLGDEIRGSIQTIIKLPIEKWEERPETAPATGSAPLKYREDFLAILKYSQNHADRRVRVSTLAAMRLIVEASTDPWMVTMFARTSLAAAQDYDEFELAYSIMRRTRERGRKVLDSAESDGKSPTDVTPWTIAMGLSGHTGASFLRDTIPALEFLADASQRKWESEDGEHREKIEHINRRIAGITSRSMSARVAINELLRERDELSAHQPQRPIFEENIDVDWFIGYESARRTAETVARVYAEQTLEACGGPAFEYNKRPPHADFLGLLLKRYWELEGGESVENIAPDKALNCLRLALAGADLAWAMKDGLAIRWALLSFAAKAQARFSYHDAAESSKAILEVLEGPMLWNVLTAENVERFADIWCGAIDLVAKSEHPEEALRWLEMTESKMQSVNAPLSAWVLYRHRVAGDTFFRLGQADKAIEEFKAGLAIVNPGIESSQKLRVVNLRHGLVKSLIKAKRFEEALTVAEGFAKDPTGEQNFLCKRTAETALARALAANGKTDLATEEIEAVIAQLDTKKLASDWIAADVHQAFAAISMGAGDTKRAVQEIDRALAIFQDTVAPDDFDRREAKLIKASLKK